MRFLVLALVFGLAVVGCAPVGAQPSQQRDVEQKVQKRKVYVEQNDVEFKNYNRRQVLADDPTTILWCTSAFPVPSSPLFTVPIVGKLTSGNKRPFPTSRAIEAQSYTEYSPERPGPDGMYGSSGEYRYGFTPNDVYADFYGISTFCTTEPTVWQRESTQLVMQTDPELSAAQKKARDALAKGDMKEAERVLSSAIQKTKDR